MALPPISTRAIRGRPGGFGTRLSAPPRNGIYPSAGTVGPVPARCRPDLRHQSNGFETRHSDTPGSRLPAWVDVTYARWLVHRRYEKSADFQASHALRVSYTNQKNDAGQPNRRGFTCFENCRPGYLFGRRHPKKFTAVRPAISGTLDSGNPICSRRPKATVGCRAPGCRPRL
jgi:hypothetical protein